MGDVAFELIESATVAWGPFLSIPKYSLSSPVFKDLRSNLDIQCQWILNLMFQQSFLCLLWIKSSSIMSVQSTCVWICAQFGFSQWHQSRQWGQPTNYHQCNQTTLAMSQTTHRGHNDYLSPQFHTTSLISSFNYGTWKTHVFGKWCCCTATKPPFRSSMIQSLSSILQVSAWAWKVKTKPPSRWSDEIHSIGDSILH